MRIEASAFLARFIASGFHASGTPNWRFIALVLGIALVQSLLVFGASFYDGTLFLPKKGDGFLEHYGVWAILATDPLLLISASFAYRRFVVCLHTLPMVAGDEFNATKDDVVRPYTEFLDLNGRAKFVYALLLFIGILCWLNNLKQTIDPTLIYGNDVFDGYAHKWGFFANKLNLFSSWVLVYPIVGFQLVTMSISIRIILQRLNAQN